MPVCPSWIAAPPADVVKYFTSALPPSIPTHPQEKPGPAQTRVSSRNFGGWRVARVIRVASESEQQANRPTCRLRPATAGKLRRGDCKQSGPPVGPAACAPPRRVARITRNPGCKRKRATSEPSHLPLAPSARRLQAIGATRGLSLVDRSAACRRREIFHKCIAAVDPNAPAGGPDYS